MKKHAFTLLEIIAVIVIVGILATVALPMIQNVMEDSSAQVCETNLKAIKTGLDLYIMERGTVPGSISEIPDSYLEKGFASVMSGKDAWKTQLAYRIIAWRDRGLAYAQLSIQDLVRGNVAALTCPKDKTPPSLGGTARSYCLNPNLANMNGQIYKTLAPDVVLVAECDQLPLTSGNLVHRHTSFAVGVPPKVTHYAQAAQPGGAVAAFVAGQAPVLTVPLHLPNTTNADCKYQCGNNFGLCKSGPQAHAQCQKNKNMCDGYCDTSFSQ